MRPLVAFVVLAVGAAASGCGGEAGGSRSTPKLLPVWETPIGPIMRPPDSPFESERTEEPPAGETAPAL